MEQQEPGLVLIPLDQRHAPRDDRRRGIVRALQGFATYRIAVGKRHKVSPGAIVGAIANEGGLHRSDFGHISIRPDHSLVELPVQLSSETVKALERTRIQGILINLQPDRPPRKAGKHNRKSK